MIWINFAKKYARHLPVKYPNELEDLKRYALKRIDSKRFPNVNHTFNLLICDSCGFVPLLLTIEHHSGSRKGNFRGVIYAECTLCRAHKRVFSFTSSKRTVERREHPVCRCGNTAFLGCECDRIEGEGGLADFFDEGVVVGKCMNCGQNQMFVETD